MIETNNTPEGFHGRFLAESSIFGHAMEAGLDRRDGGDEEYFPILDTEWGIAGDVYRNAQDFLDVADSPFSAEALQSVVRA